MVEFKALDVQKMIFRAQLTLEPLHRRNLLIQNSCTNCWQLQRITGRLFLLDKLSLEWKRKNYSRRIQLQWKYWALNVDIFTSELLSYICAIKCTYFSLITKITPRGTKSSITLQPSFKEFLTSVHRRIMGSEFYMDLFPHFRCWQRKLCKTDYNIKHTYLHLHLNYG